MRDSRRDEVSRFDDSSRIQPKGSVSGDCYLIYQDKCSRQCAVKFTGLQMRRTVYTLSTKCHALQAYDFFFSLAVYDSSIWIFFYDRERGGEKGKGDL